ncbi:hypothetical protein BW727_101883 [Jeotgalibaca dankookensis]|uniref:Flagellar biosynthetic protein FliO n=1 Tax=Jeotgalibaca dankookensis TaxID=708126 RepID=A0A1S6IRN1_9LACT|nr:flagellar biosynthetic protein FliO [Jeotgalibaca dankookensis]AQS54207.1 hypothetical protein BW727_101883 [Jeotgalibaca dankookensis]
MGIEYVIKSIGALAVVILMANILLKKMNAVTTKGAKNMKILEKMPLSRTSSLYIIEVTGKHYLMSGTEQHNEILKELDEVQMANYLDNQTQQNEKTKVFLTETIVGKKNKWLEKRKQG